MKKFVFALVTIFLVYVLIKCEQEPGKESLKKLTFVKTELGGCNVQDPGGLKSISNEQGDTVIFTIKNDSLCIYIGLNYICCAPFTSSSIISNDTITLNLSDTCSVPYTDCYCKCMCYYTWNFFFADFGEKEYFFKIILNNPSEDNPIIFKEGKIYL